MASYSRADSSPWTVTLSAAILQDCGGLSETAALNELLHFISTATTLSHQSHSSREALVDSFNRVYVLTVSARILPLFVLG
jgi:hypothetical protein